MSRWSSQTKYSKITNIAITNFFVAWKLGLVVATVLSRAQLWYGYLGLNTIFLGRKRAPQSSDNLSPVKMEQKNNEEEVDQDRHDDHDKGSSDGYIGVEVETKEEDEA